MAGRTVLLIVSENLSSRSLIQTHHVHLAAPMSDYLVSLHGDGTIKSAGPIEDGYVSEEELEGDAAVDEKDAPIPDEPKAEEKKPAKALVKAEEKSEGRISKRAMISFFR